MVCRENVRALANVSGLTYAQSHAAISGLEKLNASLAINGHEVPVPGLGSASVRFLTMPGFIAGRARGSLRLTKPLREAMRAKAGASKGVFTPRKGTLINPAAFV